MHIVCDVYQRKTIIWMCVCARIINVYIVKHIPYMAYMSRYVRNTNNNNNNNSGLVRLTMGN